eukprot:XP_014790857.1 PREDICTED: zinc finger protein 271-like [Octopus bimaculoides]
MENELCENQIKCKTQSESIGIKKEDGKTSHQYDICGKSFSEEGYPTNYKYIHTGEKPYHCVICGKTFFGSSGLTIHISDLTKHIRIHTGEKPYCCTVCGESFSQSSNLARHYYTHTGEKAYHCDICNKSFSRNTDLATHKRIHTGLKPYRSSNVLHICTFLHRGMPDSSDLFSGDS